MKKLMLWLGLGPDDAYEDLSDEPVLRGPLSSPEFAEARIAADTGGSFSGFEMERQLTMYDKLTDALRNVQEPSLRTPLWPDLGLI